MKYFKVKIKRYYKNNMIATDANGDKIPNAEIVFENMNCGNFQNIPSLFDYFSLESYDKEEYWEWLLCDVYKFTRLASYVQGWLISEKLKKIIELFYIAQPCQFYDSKLLYANEKLNFHIMQFYGKATYKIATEHINFGLSKFYNPATNNTVYFKNIDDYSEKSNLLYTEYNTDYIKSMIVLRENIDFFPMQGFYSDNIVSEKLKNAMEENGIEGFEFSELDYEVVVEK